MDILDNIILSDNQNKEYKYEDYKKEEEVADVEVTTISLKDSGSAIKNPVMVTKGGIEPEGTLEITQNGQYNVTEYAEANINVADIPAKLQTKSVTPTKSTQTVEPDSTYEGLSSVTVNPIPSNYIQTSGTLEITENGEKDVTSYAKVNVNVAGSGGESLTPVTIEVNLFKNTDYDESFNEISATESIDSALTIYDRDSVKFRLSWFIDADDYWNLYTPSGSVDFTYTKSGSLDFPSTPINISGVTKNVVFVWNSYNPSNDERDYPIIGSISGRAFFECSSLSAIIDSADISNHNAILKSVLLVTNDMRNNGVGYVSLPISFSGGIHLEAKDGSIT